MKKSALVMGGVLVLLAGCTGWHGGVARDGADTFSQRADGRTGAAAGADRLAVDIQFLDAFAEEISAVLLEAGVLAQRTGGRTGFTAEDLDRHAYLMFRFQLCRSALWDIAESYRSEPALLGRRTDRLMAQLISIRTAMQIAHGDSQFLLHFHDHEESRAALNHGYPLAGLEAGTYDAILETALDPANLDARDAAWHYFLAETEPTGEIGRAMEDDAAMRAMVDAVRQHHTFGFSRGAGGIDQRQ